MQSPDGVQAAEVKNMLTSVGLEVVNVNGHDQSSFQNWTDQQWSQTLISFLGHRQSTLFSRQLRRSWSDTLKNT